MGVVYIARNTVNNKCYVGKTVATISVRKRWHQATASRGEGWSFHRAIRKHGREAFAWDVLAESNDPAELGRLEQHHIAQLKTKSPHGYNLTDGGDGVTGRTPEAMARIVAFHTGRKRPDITRQRLSEAMTGKQIRLGAKLSQGTKSKIAASLTGKVLSEGTKAKIGAAFKSVPKSPEQRAKMSEARRAWWARKRATT